MATRIQRSRKTAFDRQGGDCYYCGLRMWLHGSVGPSALRCTAEHLIARSDGGQDNTTNIVAACWHCNHTRHKRKDPPTPERYRTEVRQRISRGAWLPTSALIWGRAHSQADVKKGPEGPFSTDATCVTPPSPTSPDSAACPHPSRERRRCDTPATAAARRAGSGSARRSVPACG